MLHAQLTELSSSLQARQIQSKDILMQDDFSMYFMEGGGAVARNQPIQGYDSHKLKPH